MKRLLAAIITTTLITAAPASAVELEEGAVFYDNGRCVEADGTEGLSAGDGQCITPADYDELFSYENLAAIEALNPHDGSTTVAEVYNIDPELPASLRLLGVGLVEVPFTFVEVAGGQVML